MQPVRLGIIGTGIAARDLHWPALEALTSKFQVSAVCNHSEQKARDFATLAGNVPWHLDYHELLARKDVDAVAILLPIPLNHDVTLAALQTGKHVMVEKPLAASLHAAKAMCQFPQQFPNLKMLVAENFRYVPVFLKMAELLQNNVIGNVFAANWTVYYHLDPGNKYAQTQWRINHQYPGGFILDGGVHNIAALRLMFGDIVTVAANCRAANPAIGEMDTLQLLWKNAAGVAGSLHIMASVRGFHESRLVVFGDQGSLVLDMAASPWRIEVNTADGSNESISMEHDGGYVAQYEDFHAAIMHDKPVKSDFQQGLADMKVLLDAFTLA